MPTLPAKVHAPGKLTMINPTMGAVGMLTDMCAGDRGVLQITMPNKQPCRRGVYPHHADGRSLSHELPCVRHGQSDACFGRDLYETLMLMLSGDDEMRLMRLWKPACKINLITRL